MGVWSDKTRETIALWRIEGLTDERIFETLKRNPEFRNTYDKILQQENETEQGFLSNFGLKLSTPPETLLKPTKVQPPTAGATASWAKPTARKRIQAAVVAAPKSALQVIASTPQVAASFMQEWAERKPFLQSLDPITEEQRVKVLDLSQKIVQKNRAMIKKKRLLPSPEAGKVERFLYDLGGGATTLAGAVGISFLTKSPHAASVLFGLYQKGQLYQEAREFGVEPKKASVLSTVGGGVEGALEYIGLDFLFKRYGGRLISHAIRGGIEGMQEWSQKFGENVIVKLGWDKTRALTEGTARSAVMGVILGSGASVVISKVQREGGFKALEETEFTPETPKGQEIIKQVVEKEMEVATKELEQITTEEAPPIEKPPVPTQKPIEAVKPEEGVKLPVEEIAGKKEAWQMTQKEFGKSPLVMSEGLRRLHENKVRAKGMNLARDEEVQRYFKELEEAVKSGKGESAHLLEETINAYYQKDYKKATKLSELALGKLHQDEKATLSYEHITKLHKESISQAIKEGKPVPAEVLKDYPDLAKVQLSPEVEVKKTVQEETKSIEEDLNTERKLATDWLRKVRRDLSSKSVWTRREARKRLPEAQKQLSDLRKRNVKQHAQAMEDTESPLGKTITNVVTAIRQAEEVGAEQQELWSKELARKMAEAGKIKITDRESAGLFMSKFRGKMQKLEFESLTKNISQKDIDALFAEIGQTSKLTKLERLPAITGLGKIFGEFGGGIPHASELILLNRVFGSEFTKAVLSKRILIKKMKDVGVEFLNVPRAILTSFDLSFGFRQGIMALARHPIIFSHSFIRQFKWFVSEKSSQEVMKAIKEHPNYELALKSGLPLVERGGPLAQRVEAFMSELAEKIPVIGAVIKASNRAYTTFANRLRFDIFNHYVKNMEILSKKPSSKVENFLKKIPVVSPVLKYGGYIGLQDLNPHTNIDLTRKVAGFIGNMTGRGSLGWAEKIAVELNTALFSPRLIASRLKMGVFAPAYYVTLPPYVRRELLKTLFAFASMVAMTLGLAKWVLEKKKWGSVETRWSKRTSADYLKIKSGNTRTDIMGGQQQLLVLAMRMQSGQMISSTTGKVMTLGKGYRALNRLDILYRTIEMKQAPVFSFATALLRGKTVIGEKVSVPKEIGKRFVPMVIQDMYDLYKEEPSLLPLSAFAVFGVGMQTYKGRVVKHKPTTRKISRKVR